MEVKKIQTKKLKGKTRVTVVFDIPTDEYTDHESVTKRVNNNTWLLKHYAEFFPFDWSYNFTLLADSLEKTGRHSLDEGHLLHAESKGKSMLFASAMLKQLCEGKEVPEHLTMYYKRGKDSTSFLDTINWEDDDEETTIHHPKYIKSHIMDMVDEEYFGKMTRLAIKKERELELSASKRCFDFISKHFRGWWD